MGVKHTDYTERERAWLWISRVLGARVAAIERLLKAGGSPAELRRAVLSGKDLGFAEHLSDKERALLSSSANDASIDRYIAWLDGFGVYAVTRDSADYPDLLRQIYDPPAVLYSAGRLKRQTELPIAVIGSRKSSDYGVEIAEYFGRQLAKYGACVVSGLAVGCDAAASKGALSVAESEYPTVAVLGSGLLNIYPAKNKKLCREIAERGAVISEFLPNAKPTRFSFPQRNRIISGLSRGVLVVEAGANSGTSITVDFALDQGRDVFAAPGRITDKLSFGTNAMIKRGEAKPVFDVDDIFAEYGIHLEELESSPVKNPDTARLSPPQRRIFSALVTGEKNAEELCEATGFGIAELNMHLTEMELSGIIRQLSNNSYSV